MFRGVPALQLVIFQQTDLKQTKLLLQKVAQEPAGGVAIEEDFPFDPVCKHSLRQYTSIVVVAHATR